jgi:lysozyme
MRRKPLRILVVGLAFLVCVAILYQGGFWIPNYPSEKQFPIRGIDVSHHQGFIDWTKVAQSKVHFVYIKATEGSDLKDVRFGENWKGAGKAGLRRGAYHFFTLRTSGSEQAKNFIATLPKGETMLPPVIDLEFGGNSYYRPPVAEFEKELKDFIFEVKTAFRSEPVLYVDNGFYDRYLRGFSGYRLWVRDVFQAPPKEPSWTFWQFSERTKVPGIDGYVDGNVFSGTGQEFLLLK